MAQLQTHAVDTTKSSKFTGRSVQSGLPVTLPLMNLEDLFGWKPNDPLDKGQPYSVASVPHCPKVIQPDAVKTLVCHDMKGGYVEDRFVQGTKSENPVGYHIQYWSGIDIFVYFSHHFVTIPPVVWINAAHRNGVTVLGTLITEGSDGAARCRAFLSTEALWKATADKLVEIAKYYHFDGWLMNFECQLELAEVRALRDFVQYLTEQMHLLDENSLVIWYDSVTCDGKLAWQNELNDKNRCFYEVSDGIFLNYAWSVKQLEISRQASKSPSKVYVGIDVFGRGVFGGGGYNTSQALTVIRRLGLSAAIFAPGWVYEEFGPENFAANNERFWKLLRDLTPNYPLPVTHRLTSTFCPGYGQKRDPGSVRDQRWYCLNWQETMPQLTGDDLSLAVTPAGSHLVVSSKAGQQRVRARGRCHAEDEGAGKAEVAPLYQLELASSADGCVTLDVREWKNARLPVLRLKTDAGSCDVDFLSGDKKSGSFEVEHLANPCGVYSACVKHPTPFRVLSLTALADNTEAALAMLEIQPGRHVPAKPGVVATPVTCKLVDWAQDTASKKLLELSCSLRFASVPKGTQHTAVLYRLYSDRRKETVQQLGGAAEPEFLPLGRAYTDRYRVHALPVNNPKYEGPGCSVEFLVRHVGALGMTVGEGRVILVYSECTPGSSSD